MGDAAHRESRPLLVRAAEADVRAATRLAAALEDFALPDDARLDDRVRSAVAADLTRVVAATEASVRREAAQLLVAEGEPELALELTAPGSVIDRLRAAGLARDPELMRELMTRARAAIVAGALPPIAPDHQDMPSLLARLVSHADGEIAAGARALLAAESARRSDDAAIDLPPALQARLRWWIAAALRDTGAKGSRTLVDRALARAAADASYGGDRVEVAALALARAIDGDAEDLPALLIEALGDRRLTLFVAFLAHAMGIDCGEVREIVLDPPGDRLWLILRGLEIGRDAIAQIGLVLCDADPRRDVEAFADMLDAIVAIHPAEARAAIAPFKLPRAYRAAMLALSNGRLA